MRRSKYESLIILITTLVVAGLPRLFNLAQFITGDELLWLERSRLFFHALQDGSWPTTYLSGHPGVTTMWLGSAGWTIVEWLHPGGATSGALTYDDPHIIIILPYLRIPIAIVTACCIAAAVQIVYRLFGALVGWLAMLMLALDPFYLAHSRTLHQDALTASFSLLFILCLLAYLLYRRSLGYLLFSAIAAALATLSKTTALVFLPFWGLISVVLLVHRRPKHAGVLVSFAAAFGLSALWLAIAAVTVYDIWPAMWTQPISVVQRVLTTATTYAATPHGQGVYFLGKVTDDPGIPYYVLTLLYALTPVAMLGLMASLCGLVRPLNELGAEDHDKGQKASLTPSDQRLAILLLWSSAAYFVLVMGFFGDKKQGRYMLPALLLLDVVAAWGLAAMGVWMRRWLLKNGNGWNKRYDLSISMACVFAILILQAATLFPYRPYYHSYYNPLLGGGQAAVNYITVGWGEGFDQAAVYLNAKENASSLSATAWPSSSFSPLFRGETVPVPRDERNRLPDADYALLYISGRQRNYPSEEFYEQAIGNGELEKVIEIDGIEYIHIYRMNAVRVHAYVE